MDASVARIHKSLSEAMLLTSKVTVNGLVGVVHARSDVRGRLHEAILSVTVHRFSRTDTLSIGF